MLIRASLHQQIAGILREELLKFSTPGQKIDSESKLAKRFGVSAVTVREALLVLVKEGFLDRRKGSGTYVTDRSRNQFVGILIDLDISHPSTSYHYLRVTQQLRRFFQDRGYRAKLYVGHKPRGEKTTDPTCPEFLEDVEQYRVCAVAAVDTPPHASWLTPLQNARIPVVGDPQDYSHGVGYNFAGLLRQGVERLLEAGRRRIAVMSWAFPSAPADSAAVVRAAMQAVGVPFHEGWIACDIDPTQSNGVGWEKFRELWVARDEKPDGLVVTDDMLFPDAATAIVDLGIRVPEQLLVVSHTNKGSGMFLPFPVQCMEADPDVYARAMGTMVLDLLNQRIVSEPHVRLGFEWIERGLAAPLPRRAKVETG